MQTLEPSDQKILALFLAGVDRPDGTLSYPALEGFLFAVVCSPAQIGPADWLPLVFAGEPACYSSQKESDQIVDLIVRLYSLLQESFMDETDELPDDCAVQEPALANFDDEAPIAQWSRGFELGHEWLGAHWEAVIPAEFFDEAVAAAATLGFFASTEQAHEILHDSDEVVDHDELAHVASAVLAMLPDAMNRYANVRRQAQGSTESDQSERTANVDTKRKPGLDVADDRACPCGSGRTYGRCCGSRLQ